MKIKQEKKKSLVNKPKKKKEEIEIIPSTEGMMTILGIIRNPLSSDTFMLDELMRKFQSSKRFSRERVFEGKERKEIEPLAKPLFLNNSRYTRDALEEAQASISSQKELLPTYVADYKKDIKRIEKEIGQLLKSKKENKEDILAGKKAKLKNLDQSIAFFEHHIKNGTVPKMVDGSKKLLKLLNKGKITNQEWKDARSNAIYSRGEKSKGGNENMKLTYVKDNLFEISVLNPLAQKKGSRLTFIVEFPAKFTMILIHYLLTGESYSIRILRNKGKYEVHVTLDTEVDLKMDFKKGCAGIDINPDNLAVTILHPNGNYRTSKVFWLNEVNTVRSNKRSWIIGNVVQEMIQWIQSFGITMIVIEQLKFDNKHSSSVKFNRMIHNFSYKEISDTIVNRCYKEKILLIQVNAHYSSLIGRLKYKKRYGLSDHQAAAMVIARRGMGFKEKIPPTILSVLFPKEGKEGQKLTGLFTHWKKVKAWADELRQEAYKKKINYKSWFAEDYLQFYKEQKAS